MNCSFQKQFFIKYCYSVCCAEVLRSTTLSDQILLFQEERTLLLTELKIQKEKKQQLGKELEKYQESDPEILEKLKQEADMAHEAANRWTGWLNIQLN